MTPQRLAQGLLEAVRAQDFAATPDARRQGAAVEAFPSLDLAVAGFPPGGAPVVANVLFSREHPQGRVATIAPGAGPVTNVTFMADLRDAQGVSIAWLPGADWWRLPWKLLRGDGPLHVVAPYPASLLKLMVAVGVGLAVDGGAVHWDAPWTHDGRERTVDAWCRDMIAISCNVSTSAMVALLHAHGVVGPQRHRLHAAFEARGLDTLRLDGTQPDGGWGNAAGAGVGRIQMTAWDTVRLLWLLDPAAPAPEWPGAAPLFGPSTRDRVLGWLADQQLHHVLGRPADAEFWHKTGTTENYASDAGIVRGRAPRRRHYLVALLSNLGSRYVPGAPEGATPARLLGLGAAVDALMASWLEAGPP